MLALKSATAPVVARKVSSASSIRPVTHTRSLVARATPPSADADSDVSTALLAFAAISIPFELLTFWSEYGR